ncbi:uncharacterized protein LOC62_05G007660 [Vanrija pseudolonga]|uniref:Uncharacterized protein n=1 Tax=Vanrija pseudolonga TaxID=143232 RepID=A0AAF0YFP1_9TREE|nr:hypothetical protein LOC62_05G007660 [Vanrija pseudolonga]
MSVEGAMIPSPHFPVTNKTWPTDWHWANISSYPGVLQQWQANPIVPGGGYYLKLTSDITTGNATTYAVSELFEFRETKKTDPSIPGGPYGPLHNTAGRTLPSLGLVATACAIGVWSLV